MPAPAMLSAAVMSEVSAAGEHRQKEMGMAGLKGRIGANAVATGTSTKTLLELSAPAGAGVRVKSFTCSFDGTSPTEAKPRVELLKGGTTGTGTSATPAKVSGHTGSITATGKSDNTVEPSGGTVIFRSRVHPQGGFIDFPVDILLNPGEMLALRTTATVSRNADVGFEFEE